MANEISLKPIAFVHGGRSEPIDDAWDDVRAMIVFDTAQFSGGGGRPK